jgi:ParB/RepB/Spo0J family partition protein
MTTQPTFYPALPLADLQASPKNPRKYFDLVKLEELAQSIREKGIVQPLLARPIYGEDGQKSHLELVVGERRYRAALLAEQTTVPCTVRELSDRDAYEIMAIENVQRVDMSPAEEAEAYRELRNTFDYTVEMIAEKVGKSQTYVYQRLKLADMDDAAKADLAAGHLPLRFALAIARLPLGRQAEALGRAYEFEKHPVPFSDFQRDLERHFMLDLATAAFSKSSEKLVPEAGSCKKCTKRTGTNPTLFDDLTEKDSCTDSNCYNGKLDAHLVEQQAKLAAKGPLIQISDRWSTGDRDQNILPSRAFREANKDDAEEQVVSVLVVEGHDRGKLRKVVLDESAHQWLNGDTTKPTKQENSHAVEHEKRVKTAEFLTKLRFAVFQEIAWSLDPQTINMSFALSFICRYGQRSIYEKRAKAALFEALQLAAPDSPGWPEDFFSATLNEEQLLLRGILIAACYELVVQPFGVLVELTDQLTELAAQLEIDVPLIRKQLKEKDKSATKKKAKPQPEEIAPDSTDAEEAQEAPKRKAGRPAKAKPEVDPEAPKPKRGRPPGKRKTATAEEKGAEE